MYDFTSLSWLDFEELIRDLVGAELGVRFESFAPGPDGGMDGRHAKGAELVILQAKHYVGSSLAALKSALRAEVAKVRALKPSRYIVATSRPITSKNKDEIVEIFGGTQLILSDMLGPSDLNQLLRKHPEIEKAHIKLWLGSAAVMDRVVRSAAHTFSAMNREEVEAKVKVYAPNPSLDEGRARLESSHVVIISGPPGVGKTTLAEMLAFAYMSDGWDLVAIRSLDDGLASIADTEKQIFFFDDFLGKVALDSRALAARDSDLTKFISRVRKSPNARFILTTRAYILEEARRASEHIADQRIEVSKYVLDVGVYTRRIRARILYNHLLVAETPIEHIRALVGSDQIRKIVDHKNYNPRIIEWMTDPTRLGEIGSTQYVAAFLDTLNNPEMLWDIAFRTHIAERCRHLLYCQYFLSEYGAGVEDLQLAFESVHPALSRRYGVPFGPGDFIDALKILEGGFLRLQERSVNFVNPSLRDYMTRAVDNRELLLELARAAPTARWAQAVWNKLRSSTTPDELRRYATAFETVASKFPSLPGWRVSQKHPNSSVRCDLDTADRIQLLLQWWKQSNEQCFADVAIEVAQYPSDLTAPWEAQWFIGLIEELSDTGEYGDLPGADAIVAALEADLVSVLARGMASDDLETLADEIESHKTILSNDVKEALTHAIIKEVENAASALETFDSESEVEEYMRVLKN